MRLIGRLVRPYHPDSPLPLWLLLALLVLFASTLHRLADQPTTADDPVDFRPIYLGQKILATGGDPYNDQLLKGTWSDIVQREGLKSFTEPGRPEFPLLYPPWALPIFTPFSSLPWLTARVIWWIAISGFLVAIAWLVARTAPAVNRLVPLMDTLLLATVFRATDWALFVGQPMLLCLVFAFAALYLDRSGRSVPAGIALGIASFKITLVVPFVLLLIFRRRWTVLAVAALTGLALIAAFFVLLNDNPVVSLEHFLISLSSQSFGPEDPNQPTVYSREVYNTMKTQFAVLAECVIPRTALYAGFVNLIPILLILPFWVIPLFQRRVSGVRAFLLFAVLALLSTYHLHYDALALLPLYLLARETDRKERFWLFIASGFLLLPLNGLLGRLEVPAALNVLFFNMQIGLLGLAAVLTWGMRRALSNAEPSSTKD